jgi:hypothetical protein
MVAQQWPTTTIRTPLHLKKKKIEDEETKTIYNDPFDKQGNNTYGWE